MPRLTSSPPHIHFFFLFFYIPSVVFLCSLSHVSESQIPEQELQVLLKLRQSWQDPSSLAHWVTSNSSSHCTWPEITCQDGSITELNLVNLNINYSIPPLICDLKNLTKLNVSSNKIPGDFPTVLYNCSKLVYLDLSQNYFEGPIPSDIDRMANLQILILAANSFSFDVPASISRLRRLRILHLYQSEYNGTYPQEIFSLSDLEELRLVFNGKFVPSQLPQNFTALKKLRFFSMAQTNLFGKIPEMVGDMEGLKHLDLGRNLLTGEIPGNIFAPRNLSERYDEYTTNVSRSIPQSVSVVNLSVIDLSNNNLTGNIPEDFGKLKKLTRLNLEYNQFSGGIPEGISRLSALSDVILSHNNLSGTIPPDFGKFSALGRFEVAFNNLTGTLPKQLCHGGMLFGLAAMDNNLGGELPESLGSCSSLADVRLNNNGFTGNVPGGLWTSPNLTILILSGNELTGELPMELSPNLTWINISDNRFFDKIPSTVSSWRNLEVFDASTNFLSSTVPTELTELPFLRVLLLGENELSGNLPTNVVSWKSLNLLNLSHNRLSGPVPREIGLLPVLMQLDLSENELSDSVPPEMGLLKLNLLNLSSNRLSGRIPEELENAKYDASFLNNPSLCASNSFMRLNVCNSQSRRLSKKNLALIVISAIAGASVIFSTVVCKIRVPRENRDLFNSTLEMTQFQTLNFTESDILSGLKEGNVIGSGGSGNVYRINVNPLDAVAVKMILNKRKLDKKLEKQFVAEAEILGNIKHLHIIKLLCCDSCEDKKLLVYKYMENSSLDHWLHKKKRLSPISGVANNMILDWPRRLQIALGAAKGLCYMHHDYLSRPIIHRDVKSNNILLDSTFNAKIADFGLARMLHGVVTTVSSVDGTFGYLAPEYNHTKRVNEKIDVYSFRVVLLELTTGREPCEGNEDMGLADWAWFHFHHGKPISDVIDEEIRDNSYVDQISNVFKLGIFCTARLPSTRPTMKEVVQMLLKCSDPHYDVEKKFQHKLDAAPLLGNSKYEDMPRSDFHVLECNTY